MTNRRDFIKLSALATSSLFVPRFLKGLNAPASLPAFNGRRLVVIQFSGGNDGLNTCVPYRNDIYYRSRPKLAIQPDEVLKITDELGLHPAMEALRPVFDEGQMSILNSVGYPNPDRSHFRSMDIWHTGSNSDEYWESGWLGRYLDASCEGCAKPHDVIETDNSLSLAVKGETSRGLAVTNPKRLYETTKDPYLNALGERYLQEGNSDLDYLYKTMTETVSSVSYIHNNAKTYRTGISYPMGPFARNLKLIAELIGSGIETPVYYASLTGFDTHVNQKGPHQRLLKTYAEGMAAFIQDLKASGNLEDTLILTFSEFGRRVEQNASGGTDHGKANALFVLGGALSSPDVYNPTPDLARLDEGDLAYEIDFRQVYATVLHDWLGADDQAILKRNFRRLPLI